MFVYETINKLDDKHEIITGKTLIEICGSVLEYYNGALDNKQLDYTVAFMNSEGEIVLEIAEKNIRFALHGANGGSITPELADASSEFWSMKHNEIEIIAFNNPCRFGEATWDSEYIEDDDDSNDGDDEHELINEETNQNIGA
jgi:hypothetical protein